MLDVIDLERVKRELDAGFYGLRARKEGAGGYLAGLYRLRERDENLVDVGFYGLRARKEGAGCWTSLI
jgi:hypothetical protein